MDILLAIVIGLAVGSFANVVVDRVPTGRTIFGRSTCDRCRRQLRWWELLPVASACGLRFRCRTCDGRIPWRYAVVEAGTAALFVALLAHHGGWTFRLAVEAVALVALGVLALIDLRERVVPDAVSIPVIILILIGSTVAGRSVLPIASAAVGAAFFGVQRLVSQGRWVGDGDTRVGAIIGALLPLPLLAVAMGAAYVIGGFLATVLLATRRVARGAHLPLVPFLFLGTLVAVFWGADVLTLYGL